ncbi:MAG: DUF167 family protein [Proteobacteria bacterium]|nr:DUF167 family protein [Pseudomonadota bacterium]
MRSDSQNSPVIRTEDGVTVAVRVSPGARSSRIGGTVADVDGRRALKVAVTTIPEGGKANAAVIALLAKSWRVPKSSITIQSGAAAQRKILRVKGDASDLKQRIEASMTEAGNG